MINLNGHPYVSMREKAGLWEYYRERTDFVSRPDVRIMWLEVREDIARLVPRRRVHLVHRPRHQVGPSA
ncbi:hypothetical protein AGRA3207_002062 [Actinomadura graeca]|uniref:Uncharacterized protein n=1 Tax=Actinomadura graeca TaxID=2750812 RepID=A0ABX8QR68_9ACTN|nr:hypothetical protein [Actinomadura graeca]QXJ21227.1 hypothetical protein AGRA3207_002062 [Actinomadura graeca]